MKLHNHPIKAVVFDLDDTLIDWSEQTMGNFEINHTHMGNIHLYLEERDFVLPSLDEFLLVFRNCLITCWTEAKETWAGAWRRTRRPPATAILCAG